MVKDIYYCQMKNSRLSLRSSTLWFHLFIGTVNTSLALDLNCTLHPKRKNRISSHLLKYHRSKKVKYQCHSLTRFIKWYRKRMTKLKIKRLNLSIQRHIRLRKNSKRKPSKILYPKVIQFKLMKIISRIRDMKNMLSKVLSTKQKF